jgi:hypothetical protein
MILLVSNVTQTCHEYYYCTLSFKKEKKENLDNYSKKHLESMSENVSETLVSTGWKMIYLNLEYLVQ